MGLLFTTLLRTPLPPTCAWIPLFLGGLCVCHNSPSYAGVTNDPQILMLTMTKVYFSYTLQAHHGSPLCLHPRTRLTEQPLPEHCESSWQKGKRRGWTCICSEVTRTTSTPISLARSIHTIILEPKGQLHSITPEGSVGEEPNSTVKSDINRAERVSCGAVRLTIVNNEAVVACLPLSLVCAIFFMKSTLHPCGSVSFFTPLLSFQQFQECVLSAMLSPKSTNQSL